MRLTVNNGIKTKGRRTFALFACWLFFISELECIAMNSFIYRGIDFIMLFTFKY